MSSTPAAVIGDHLTISSNTAGAPASRLVSRSTTSDRERASRLRSAPVANSRGFDLTRPYFDGGCSMPATSAVEPVLPVEGAAPASTVEHVRPSTGRANLSMADTVAVICGARAAACVCGREPAHDDIHECAERSCRGQWTGEYGTDSWDVVRFPATFTDEVAQ